MIVAGAPLSYSAGVDGRNPDAIPAACSAQRLDDPPGAATSATAVRRRLAGQQLENLNPANTYWTKYYNLFAKVDRETPRFP